MMKGLVVVGVVLIVLGIVALAYQGFTYTTREKVIDLGPLKASVEKEKTVAVPPPLLGQHSDEILREVLGLKPAAITKLHADGVI